MAKTDLDLCNQAIALAGGEPLQALDDSTPIGEFCVGNYPAGRDYFLAMHRWVFADRRIALTQRTTPGDSPMQYAYERPVDLVGAIHAYRDGPGERDRNVRADQTADYIAADSAVLWVEYTARVPEAVWPPWFEQLVVKAFAIPLARRVGKASVAAQLDLEVYGPPEMNREGGLVLSAKQADGRNAPPRRLMADGQGPMVDTRLSYGVGDFWRAVRHGGG